MSGKDGKGRKTPAEGKRKAQGRAKGPRRYGSGGGETARVLAVPVKGRKWV